MKKLFSYRNFTKDFALCPNFDSTRMKDLYARRIRAISACLIIGRGASHNQAATLFEAAEIEWFDLLVLFNHHYKMFDFISQEPTTQLVDPKYPSAVSTDNVVGFIASQSMEKIRQEQNLVFIEAYLRIMIDNGATQIELFETVTQLIDLHLSQEILAKIVEIFTPEAEKYPNSYAHLLWKSNNFDGALKIWSDLNTAIQNDATFGGINQFGPLVLAEMSEAIEVQVLNHLSLFLDDSDWFVRIVGKLDLDEKTMITRLSDHPKIKMVYLEHLVSQTSKHQYVYVELAKIYLSDQKFAQLRAFIRMHEKKINHETILKWLKEGCKKNVESPKADVY